MKEKSRNADYDKLGKYCSFERGIGRPQICIKLAEDPWNGYIYPYRLLLEPFGVLKAKCWERAREEEEADLVKMSSTPARSKSAANASNNDVVSQ